MITTFDVFDHTGLSQAFADAASRISVIDAGSRHLTSPEWFDAAMPASLLPDVVAPHPAELIHAVGNLFSQVRQPCA